MRKKDEKGRFVADNLIDVDGAREMYISQNMSVESVAKSIGVGSAGLYKLFQRLGITRKLGETRKANGNAKRENNQNWKGGKTIHNGYVVVNVDGKYVYEHRLVAENFLGRELKKGEVIHHIDGDKTNNSPENIRVFSSHAEHMREQHMSSMIYLPVPKLS